MPVELNYEQASQYLEGASNNTIRSRPFTGWLDKAGRIKRGAEGKDFNWLIEYKDDTAEPYSPYSQLSFASNTYVLPAVVTPVFWKSTSGLDVTTQIMNKGPATIVDLFEQRTRKLATANYKLLDESLFGDGTTATFLGKPSGIGTLVQQDTGVATLVTDKVAAPGGTYAGNSMGLAANGGSWSANLASTAGVRMNAALGTDWPDGPGDPQYDCLAPRLYNENCTLWNDDDSSRGWKGNCVNMLSRANTDLRLNSDDMMAPTMHFSGSDRMQAFKDLLRKTLREIAPHTPSRDMGYPGTIAFENAMVDVAYDMPADRTYSINPKLIEVFLMGSVDDAQAVGAGVVDNAGDAVAGGMFFLFGPKRPAHMLQTVWIMLSGGNTRLNPRYLCCHKDFKTA